MCAGDDTIEAGKVDVNLTSMPFFFEAKQRYDSFFVDGIVAALAAHQLEDLLALPSTLWEEGGEEGIARMQAPQAGAARAMLALGC